MKEIFSWFAIALGLLAAFYWYKASGAKITDSTNRHNPGTELTYEDPDNEGKDIYVVATAMEQSRLNKIAAIYTALAVLFQAIAAALPYNNNFGKSNLPHDRRSRLSRFLHLRTLRQVPANPNPNYRRPTRRQNPPNAALTRTPIQTSRTHRSRRERPGR